MRQGPEVLQEAIRQAETSVRAGEVGLLVEQGWVWSILEHLEAGGGSALGNGPSGFTAGRGRWSCWGSHPSLVPTGCVRDGETAPLLQFLPL